MTSSVPVLAGLALLTVVSLYSQTSTSQITGTVSDPSGAVIPGVNVSVTNEETGAVQRQTTSGAGVYAFPALTVGRYTVSAELAGFKQQKRTGAVLVVGTPLNIDFKMEVGQATDTVDVKADVANIETSNATLGDVVTQKAIATLPLNGRNPLNLVILQPGVVQTSGGGVNVNGSRAAATNVTIDGIEANEASVPSITNNVFRLSPDNVQEFKMTTSNPTPEEGRNSGANVSIATRGGTNQIHGTLYEFFRNTDLNATDYYANARGTAKQIVQLNQFGGEVGGPVIKNKTFYFGSYEAQYVQTALPITASFGTVYLYTPTARAGTFRYFVSDPSNPFTINGQKITGNSTALVNPLTGALNPGVRNCGSPTDLNCVQSYNFAANDPKHIGLDPTIAAQLASYPNPNGFSGAGVTDGLNIGNYYWNSPNRTRGPHYLARIDHIIDANNTIFGRYTYAQQSTLNGDPLNSRPQVLPGQPPLGEVFRPAHNAVLSFRHVFSPSIVNELTAGLSRFFFNFTQGAANPAYPNIPSYSFNLETTPYNNTPPGGRAVTTPQVLDNLNIVRGSHIIRTGFNFRFYRDNDLRGQPGGDNVTPTISLSATTRAPSGFNLPSVASGATAGINSTDLSHLQSAINDLLGIPANISQRFLGDLKSNTFLPFIANNQVTLWDEGQRAKQYDSYIQDEWKPRNNLTINYGVRWEVNPAPTEAAGRVYVPNVAINGSQGPVTFVKSDSWFRNNNLGAVAPRLGIAWSPRGSQKTVVRAGYGMSFDTISLFQLTAVAGKVPGLVTNCSATPGGVSTAGCATAPDTRIGQGFPEVLSTPSLQPSSYLTLPAQLRTNAPNATVFDPNLKLPTVHEWNLTIQHELPSGIVASVGYVGRRGTRLFRAYDINQINADPVMPSFLDMQQNVANKCKADGTGCPTGVTGIAVPIITQGIISSATATSSTYSTYLAQNAAGSFAGAIENTTLAAHLRPNQQFATITYLDSGGDSYYHSLQATARKRFDSGFLLGVAYTFGKSMDDQSTDPVGSSSGGGLSTTGAGTTVDIRNWRNNRGLSDFDRKHVVSVNTIYDLPFGKGKRFFNNVPRPVDAVVGGWSLNGIGIFESGEPFSVLSGAFTENASHQSRVGLSGATQPTPSVQYLPGVVGPALFPNNTGFALPTPGSDGIGRNTFRGPTYYNLDLSATKTFIITERFHLIFRAEAFNAFNHTNFGTGDISYLSPTFGQNLSTIGTAATRNIIQTGEPGRVLQLALKLTF